ncbi:MAG: hypothetical protein DMF74_18415 [Acidobacteria bacterium]|nr:MAG: hypothetical protein DMF74_18415 [Acidobacteriota bacterium]
MVFRFALPMRGGSISSILTLTCPRFSTRCLMQSGTQNRMAQREPRRIVFPTRDELLAAARERVDLPPGKLWLDYQDDVDTLYVRLKEKTHPTHSKSNLDEMIVFDYEGEELVGIEIMDITGQLKYANPR